MFGSLIKDILDQIGGNKPADDADAPGTGAASQTDLDKFKFENAGPLALAFGKHIVAGILADSIYLPGPPPSHKFIILNGEGLGIGWDGVEKVWWGGEELSLSADDVTPGYHFHPGTFSTGIADPLQGQDSFFSIYDPSPYNGTCYTAVLLPENKSVEDRPDKLRGVYRCLKVPDFDINGVQLNVGTASEFTYSTNPARIIAFGFWRAGLLARIHWPSWERMRLYCDALIPWDDGTNPARTIKRFEFHGVWSKAVTLPELLDTVSLVTASTWSDDGSLIRFILPNDQTPSHHFDANNTVAGSFKPSPIRLRDRLNTLKISFRNLDDEFLKPSSITARREGLITAFGEIKSEIAIPNCYFSQAQRIAEVILRISTDNPNKASVEGFGDSFTLLEGDWCTCTSKVNGWNRQLCRVNSVVDLSTSSRPDVRRFELQAFNGPLYADSDHQPVQLEEEV